MNEKDLNAVQIRNDIVNLEMPFFYNNQIVIITQHTEYTESEKNPRGLRETWLVFLSLSSRFLKTDENDSSTLLSSECSIQFDSIRFDSRQSI